MNIMIEGNKMLKRNKVLVKVVALAVCCNLVSSTAALAEDTLILDTLTNKTLYSSESNSNSLKIENGILVDGRNNYSSNFISYNRK